MIAFFDVDKTLCDGYSGYYTTRELIRRGIVKKRRILKAVLYKAVGHLFRQMNVRRMYEIALADMAGTKLPDIMALGLEIFERYVKPILYQEALDEIQRLKGSGHQIVLISSGPYMCIKNMEGFLGADFSFSNGPVIADGILQREVAEPLVYKEGKLKLAQDFAREQGVDLKDCLFYSDAYSDLPLLEHVGSPQVVNPDRNLEKEARRRNWPIHHFNRLVGPSKLPDHNL